MDSRYHRNLQRNLFNSIICTFNTFVFNFILTNVYKYHIKKMEIRVYFEEKVIKNNMLHVYVFILHAKKPQTIRSFKLHLHYKEFN